MHNADNSAQIEELWERFLAGGLNEDEASKLYVWLDENPIQLHAYRKDARLSLALSNLLAPKSSAARLIESVQVRLQGKSAGHDSTRFKQRVMESLPVRRNVSRRAGIRPKAVRPNYVLHAAMLGIALLGGVLFLISSQSSQKIAEPSKTTPLKESVLPAAATLTTQSGTVLVDGLAVTKVSELHSGNRIEVSAEGRARLTLRDGSNLDLKDNTALTLLESEHGARLRLERGPVAVNAAHQSAGEHLTLETLHANVIVVGTRYAVEAYSHQTRVNVYDGKVMVSSTSAQGPAQALNPSEELIADARGLGPVRSDKQRRLVNLADGSVEENGDPVDFKIQAAETFAGIPLARFRYDFPRHNANNFGGIVWPVKLSPDEQNYEVWIRPRRVKPIDKTFPIAKVVMLAQLGNTEYLLGYAEVRPADKDWILLRGQIADAPVRWQMPGTPRIPLTPQAIEHIAIRTEIGEMEFDQTPIIIWAAR